MKVHQDPGWSPSLGLGLKAMFVRSRVMAVRPAIVAARAMLIPGLLNAFLIAWALALLGERGSSDPTVAWWFLAGGVVAGLAGILVTRHAREGQPSSQEAPERVFVSRVTLMSAFANLPLVAGLIGFFVGGGYLTYYVSVAATLLMLWVLVRPTKEMADRFGAALDPPLSGMELWERMLDAA